MRAPLKEWGWPRWIAHRGGGDAAPENSLGGVVQAALHGFQAIEVDIRLSADGVPMVIHDDTVTRTTGLPGRVDQYTAFELGRMRASLGFESGQHALEPIPELGMLLVVAAHHGMRVNLELKGGDESPDTLVGAVAAVLQQLHWAIPAERLLLSAFDPALLAAARHSLPHLPRALLCESVTVEQIGSAVALECLAINAAASACSRDAVTAARGAGLRVCAWTVNDAAQAASLFAAGVAAVFTDRLSFARPPA